MCGWGHFRHRREPALVRVHRDQNQSLDWKPASRDLRKSPSNPPLPGGPGSPQPSRERSHTAVAAAATSCWAGPASLDCPRGCDWPVQREGGLPCPPPRPYLARASPSCWPRLRGPACEVFVPNLGSPLHGALARLQAALPAQPSCCSQTSISPHLSPPLLRLRPRLGRKRPA